MPFYSRDTDNLDFRVTRTPGGRMPPLQALASGGYQVAQQPDPNDDEFLRELWEREQQQRRSSMAALAGLRR